MSKPDLYIYDDKEAAVYASRGSSLKSKLIGITYDDLVSIFGDPVIQSGDSINYQWVVDFDGDTFTIYDWKYSDKDYVRNELGHDGGISFHIGGKTYAGDFEDFIDDAKSKDLKFGDNKDDELPF